MTLRVNSLVKYRLIWFFVLINITIPYFHYGQDSAFTKTYNLEEVVVTSNKFETLKKNSPTKIELIPSDKIRNSNGNRLTDILKTSSSVFIKSYGLSPQLQTISINGLGAEHTLVLIDGVRMNSYQNSLVDLSLINKENIKQIEIVNNGLSSIYGSEAIGGVVNIISKRRDYFSPGKPFGVNVSAAKGSFNTEQYSFGVNTQSQKFDSRLFYSSEKSQGNYSYNFDDRISILRKERLNNSYSIFDAGINSQYYFDKNNILRVISTYSNQYKEIPGIETGAVPAVSNQTDKNWNNIITFDNALSNSFMLRSHLNYQNNLMNYSIVPVIKSYYKNLVYTGGTDLHYSTDQIKIAGGYNFIHASLNSNETESGALRNLHAVFISSEIILHKKFRVFPSIRTDYLSDLKQSILTYRLGFNCQPINDFNLSLRGNTGKNFRAPTFNDLYWKHSGNKNLNSESSINSEAGVLYSFDYLLCGQLDVSYIYIDAKDKIVWLPQRNLIWKPENIAKSISKTVSINLNLEKSFSDKITTRLESGFTFTNSKKTSQAYLGDPSFNKYFPYLPLKMMKLGLYFTYNFASINIFYSKTGLRYSDFENENKLPPFEIIDANVSFTQNIWDIKSVVKFEVNNIFNKDFQIINGYPMPLRHLLFTYSIYY